MSHYDNAQWVDYVRGLQDPPAAAAMRAHIDTGCESCGAKARRFAAVAEVARHDQRCEPPAHLLRSAKAAFSLHWRLLSAPPTRTAVSGVAGIPGGAERDPSDA